MVNAENMLIIYRAMSNAAGRPRDVLRQLVASENLTAEEIVEALNELSELSGEDPEWTLEDLQ